ncbi:MAG: hypothetical protein EOM85_01370 [Candidatus Moranbacteria bacterium]|nr:hypothetical protein [Candidatus Moranbacteria bacterium]
MFVMNFVKDGKFHAEVVFNKFFEKTLGELRSDYKKFLKNDKDKLIKIEKKNEETIDRLSNCFKGGQDLTFYFKIIKELEELFIETNNHNEFSTIVELFLEDEIGKAFRDSNITKENILLLASSQEKSFFEIYNSKLEDLSNWVKKEKIDIGDFKTAIKKEKFLNKLRDAYKSGYFLKSSYAGVNFVGMEDIFEDLVHFKKNKIESYLNLKELYSSLSSKQKEIIEISRYYSQQRDKRKEIQQKTFYLQAQCIDEISKITSIHRSDLENLRPGQFSKKIFSDKNLLFNLIKDQKKGVFLLATDMGSFTKMGDAANLFFDDVKMKDTSVDKELYGVTACKGKAKGVVRLIHNLHEDYFFEPGDILVTGMTSPNFIPIMKKAGGIITDLGGATCHAAIISRELDVPCIIGTKRSTKVLKDGDLVEVDADNGVVKILEGKNN